MIRKIDYKSKENITEEWDDIAKYRFEQIKNGKDISYKYILIPSIIKLLKDCNRKKIIDIGCGQGFLTKLLAKNSNEIVGIDISGNNIILAKRNCNNISNITLINSDIESYFKEARKNKFSTVIANMFLMTVQNLDKIIDEIASIIKPSGHFIFTITHPFFWSYYWQYNNKDWFNYKEEIIIEADFRISKEYLDKTTTHVHRSLEKYVNCLFKSGFLIEKILEPFPIKKLAEKYPHKWEYPRFMAIKCIKNR